MYHECHRQAKRTQSNHIQYVGIGVYGSKTKSDEWRNESGKNGPR